MSVELSRRVANVIETMVRNGLPHNEKLPLSRLINAADSLEDLPAKYRTAIDEAETHQKIFMEELKALEMAHWSRAP